MTFVRTGGLLATISKAMAEDPVGTSILLDEAVGNYVIDEVAANPGLQERIRGSLLVRSAVAKAALGREYVEAVAKGEYPGPEMLEHAEWLAGIEAYVAKAGFTNDLETWRKREGGTFQRRVRREGGRFAHNIAATAEPNDVRGVPRSALAPGIRELGAIAYDPNTKATSLVPSYEDKKDKLDRHQGQWEKAAEFADEVYRGMDDVRGVDLEFLLIRGEGDKMTRTAVRVPLKDVRNGLKAIPGLNPLTDSILDISVVGDEANAERVTRFNALGWLGGPKAQALGQVPQGAWSDLLGKPPAEARGDEKLFRRMRGAGSVLSAVPGAEKQAEFARLVGVLGPQAEEVLGPYVRQGAYRYRGTEKTPDAELVRAFTSQEMAATRAAADEGLTPERMQALANSAKQRGGTNIVHGSESIRAARGASGDQLRLQVNSDVAAAHLMGTLPDDPFTAKLSERAGHVLPSQGVIINAKGELVSQAVGYADDHYVPFDLKNLAALRGGQYVRTRVQGGLTGEDIYTAVQSGARMVTVVSSSGVFSLELDPAFRGARGNSDKARSMYDRYLKILDAVDASGMYLKDIPPKAKAEIRAQAAALAGPNDGTEKWKGIRTDYEKKLLARARDAAANGIDLDEATREAESRAAKDPGWAQMSRPEQARRIEDHYDEVVAEMSGEAVQELALNSAGYEMALKTLAQQFPYFIRNVSYEPLRSTKRDKEAIGFLDARSMDPTLGSKQRSGARDSGYTRPGGLRPASVESGFYRVDEGMKPKRGAGGASSAPTDAAAPGGGAGAAGAEGAKDTPGEPKAPSAAPAAGGSRLETALGLLGPAAAAQTKDATERLANALSAMPKEPVRSAAADMKWEDALATGDKAIVATHLVSYPRDIARRLASSPMAAQALADPEALRAGLDTAYETSGALGDALSSSGSRLGALLGGATSEDEAYAAITAMAQDVVHAGSVTNPFVPMASDPKQRAFYVGPKPQANPEMLDFDTREAFEAFASGPMGSEAMARGTQLESMGHPPAVLARMVEALKAAKANVPLARKSVADSLGEGGIAAALTTGMTEGRKKDLQLAMGGELPSTLAVLNEVDAEGRDAFEAAAQKWQDGFTMITAAHAIDVLNPEAGAAPKVRPLQGEGTPVEPAKAFSSPRVRAVLDPSDPLSRAVAVRKAAGLPFVPRHRRR